MHLFFLFSRFRPSSARVLTRPSRPLAFLRTTNSLVWFDRQIKHYLAVERAFARVRADARWPHVEEESRVKIEAARAECLARLARLEQGKSTWVKPGGPPRKGTRERKARGPKIRESDGEDEEDELESDDEGAIEGGDEDDYRPPGQSAPVFVQQEQSEVGETVSAPTALVPDTGISSAAEAISPASPASAPSAPVLPPPNPPLAAAESALPSA